MSEKLPALTIPRTCLFPLMSPQGFHLFDNPEEALSFLAGLPHEFSPRPACETDFTLKQIIPQICLYSNGKLFVHKIPRSAGEARLHDLWTMFLGGHIEEDTTAPAKTLTKRDRFVDGALREFREEIDYRHAFESHLLGFINLDDTEVNRAHFGLVYVFNGELPESAPTDDAGVSEGRWSSFDELRSAFFEPDEISGASIEYAQLNGWSVAAFDQLEIFCSSLRSISDVIADAERLALYRSYSVLTSPHWPFRYTQTTPRKNAVALFNQRVPIIAEHVRDISARAHKITLTFKSSGCVAEVLSAPFDRQKTPEQLSAQIKEAVEKYCDGYPIEAIRPGQEEF